MSERRNALARYHQALLERRAGRIPLEDFQSIEDQVLKVPGVEKAHLDAIKRGGRKASAVS